MRLPISFAISVLILVSGGLHASEGPGPSIEKDFCKGLSADTRVVVSRHENGRLRAIGCKRQGSPEGPYQSWYPHGGKRSQGRFFQGRLDGRWERWTDTGAKLDVGIWMAGVPHGNWVFYGPDGNVREQGPFERGRRVCLWKVGGGNQPMGRRFEVESDWGCGGGASPQLSPRSWSLGVTVGIFSHSIKETDRPDFTQSDLTPTLSGEWRMIGPLSLTGDLSLTGAVVETSLSRGSIRFLDARAGLAYRPPFIPSPWWGGLGIGVWAGKTITGGIEQLGYQYLVLPQVQPMLGRNFGAFRAFTQVSYMKLSDSRLSVLLGGERLAARGVRWILRAEYELISLQGKNGAHDIEARIASIASGISF